MRKVQAGILVVLFLSALLSGVFLPLKKPWNIAVLWVIALELYVILPLVMLGWLTVRFGGRLPQCIVLMIASIAFCLWDICFVAKVAYPLLSECSSFDPHCMQLCLLLLGAQVAGSLVSTAIVVLLDLIFPSRPSRHSFIAAPNKTESGHQPPPPIPTGEPATPLHSRHEAPPRP